jgi:hypothetical protein
MSNSFKTKKHCVLIEMYEFTYEGAIGSAIGVDSGPYDLVLIYRFLPKDLWIFLG